MTFVILVDMSQDPHLNQNEQKAHHLSLRRSKFANQSQLDDLEEEDSDSDDNEDHLDNNEIGELGLDEETDQI